jgi:superfamily II DNA/RNA helicase
MVRCRPASGSGAASLPAHRFAPCREIGPGRPDLRHPRLETFYVSVDTYVPAPPALSFFELGLPDSLVKVLARGSITTPTPVQSAVLPDALAGRDVLGRAMTGSGKTLAFGLPILARLTGARSQAKTPRAVIIVPTRELAAQVRGSLEPLAHAVGLKLATVYGGTPYDRQIKRLRAGADVVVATPGRLGDLIRRGACRLDGVEIMVLDEADHLCDLGFFPEVSELVGMTPSGSQRLLLSATLDGDVDRLVRTHLKNPVTHHCDPEHRMPDIDHHVLVTGPHNKLDTAADLLRANPRSIVFTRTRIGATNLAADLAKLGVATVDLHGALSQNARERNLRKFRTGQADIVVATDVAARGIHVEGVNLVVHYDAPSEHKAYLHRSGRTARAGNSGTVVTMTTARQVSTVVRLQKAAGVVARHHDARTAASPMTVASLATSGLSAADAGVETSGRSSGHTYNGSRHKGGSRSRTSSRSSGGQTSYKPSSSRDDRPRRESRQASSEAPKREVRAHAAAPATQRATDPVKRHTASKPGRKPGAGTGLKKARWTGAEKRAKAKR